MSEKPKLSPRKLIVLNLLLGTASLFFGLLIFEVGARVMIKPCGGCYGTLLGRRLPPFQVLAEGAVAPIDPKTVWKRGSQPNPEGLTIGDLWGMKREDREMGYTAVEDVRSVKGWWQSNNIGARSRQPTVAHLKPDQTRLMIYGESYGQASRVVQEGTWFAHLQKLEPKTDIVNLAVDGYSMGQAYLRYLHTRDHVESTSTVFMFVPESDLWRDVNTVRFLAEGWGAYTILPRFVLDGPGLKLVPGPYKIGSEIYLHDTPELTPEVKEHLRTYDPFYVRSLYETPPVIGHLIAYKLLASVIGLKKLDRVYTDANSGLHSEALEIDRRIFKSVAVDTKKAGQKFALLMLPDPKLVAGIRALNSSPNLADWKSPALKTWQERLALMETDGYTIIDLMPTLLTVDREQLDFGYDGTHYGPKTNRVLSDVVHQQLTKLDVF